MIIREHNNTYIMIEQTHHAHISGELAKQWRDDLFKGNAMRESVIYAIANHDLGWNGLDQTPFWNDLKNAPYDFRTFPMIPKFVFYKDGIDAVEAVDLYAGLLCSRHYMQLNLRNKHIEAASLFIEGEQKRQESIIEKLSGFNTELYDFHYTLLAILDNFSLYLCLNEPGTTKREEHVFFKDGIVIPRFQDFLGMNKLDVSWKDADAVEVAPFPFKDTFKLNLEQRVVSKKEITEKGVIASYLAAPIERVEIDIKRHKSQ